MAELADAQDSDSCPLTSGAGSSPVIRTLKTLIIQGFLFLSFILVFKVEIPYLIYLPFFSCVFSIVFFRDV